jgi:nucleosome binding factor SPN SPT16 subunit
VVTLADIEIASLERVQFGLKQFDLVFIFSDFSRAPQHVNSIPTAQLDNVKEWLKWVLTCRSLLIPDTVLCSSVDVPMSESPVNLAWGQIMKTINDNPYQFFKDGGWRFLVGGDGDAVYFVTSLIFHVRF